MSTEISEFPYVRPEQRVSAHFAKNWTFNFPYRSAGMFNYGSKVYGNKKPSDIDVIAVFVGNVDYCEQHKVEDINNIGTFIDVTLYSEKTFLEKVNEHEISILECVFAKKKNILVPISLYLERQLKHFVIDKSTLRRAISKKASNSYVKAKKKLLVEADYDLECSLKSLWHSIRILDFGSQLAESSTIDEFDSVNWIFKDILDTYISTECNWEEIHKKYKPIYNEFASTFRETCPKE
ncbi:hypothetical protein NVP2275O_294 [Vibrio phage 2.275.O._10N.286.54.E11]|nr:hypothetical protein NVP2275O_294 [Vibrio phage 2.275.O._10N.286.54.E11]